MLPVSRHFLPTKKGRYNQLLNIPHLGKEGLFVEHGKAKTNFFFAYVAWDTPFGDTRIMAARKKSCEIKLFLQDSYNSSSCANVISCRCTLSQSFVPSFEKWDIFVPPLSWEGETGKEKGLNWKGEGGVNYWLLLPGGKQHFWVIGSVLFFSESWSDGKPIGMKPKKKEPIPFSLLAQWSNTSAWYLFFPLPPTPSGHRKREESILPILSPSWPEFLPPG